MFLSFARRAKSAVTPLGQPRCKPSTAEAKRTHGLRADVVDYAPPSQHFEPAAKPLYGSDVYHSRLEEMPTFAVNFLSEAQQDQIVQSLEARPSN